MIQLKNFSVDNLYNDINLEIKKEQVTCIIGENGSGKSMLTKYLLGIYKNYHGEILITDNDNNVHIMDDYNYEKLRKNIKLVVHNPNAQFIGYTIEDEITYKLEQNKLNNEEISEILKSNFNNYDLNKPLSSLSSSDAQKLLILSSLTLNEKILIIDEAISNTSHEFKQKIFKLLKELKVTVLLITNNTDDTYYADEVYKLENLKLNIKEKNKKLPLIKHNLSDELEAIELSNITLNNKIIDSFKFTEKLNVITGESGSGKTTVIKSIIGLNKSIKKIRSNYRFIGYVSQNYVEQITKNTVYEQVSNKEVSSSQVEELFKVFKLDTKLYEREPSTLSTGQLAQILIIQNILRSKECIILDEVLEVIDPFKREIILNYLLDNVTCVICVTHNVSIFNNYKYTLLDLEDYEN